MAANVYYERDADHSLIAGRKVAIIGYGHAPHSTSDRGRRGVTCPGSVHAKAEASGLGRPSTRPRRADGSCCRCPTPSRRGVRDRRRISRPATRCSSHGFNIRLPSRPRASTGDGRTEGLDISCGAPTPRAACRFDRGRADARKARLAPFYADAIGALRGVIDDLQRRPRLISWGAGRAVAGSPASRPASRRSSRRATSPRWRTSSACTR